MDKTQGILRAAIRETVWARNANGGDATFYDVVRGARARGIVVASVSALSGALDGMIREGEILRRAPEPGDVAERYAVPPEARARGHSRDAHCRLGPEGLCIVCGVHHGDPCPDCGGRGFHAEACPALSGEG